LVGIYLGNTDNTKISNVVINNNLFNGPADMNCNPWKIGGSFVGGGMNIEVNDINFINNSVDSCSIPINLQDSNINDILVDNNIFRNTDGVLYVWGEGSPTGILSNFVFTNNDIDSTNTYGVGIFGWNAGIVSSIFDDSNFGIGNGINYNDFVGIPGDYGLVAVSFLATLSSYEFDATNNWWGSCDGPGFVGPGSGSNVSVNVTYTPWLGACIGNKTQTPQCILETNNVTLYANVSSKVCIGEVIFSVYQGGTWTNYTGSVSSSGIGNYSYTLDSSLLSGGETINWTVYVDDCYNHTTKKH